MQHTESSVKTFFTKEYARFRMINGNRQLNDGKIKRIIRAIAEGNDMLRYYPIQVQENNGRLDILDGQHRFYICKHLDKPVYYILVSEVKTMPEIAKVNSNVDKWKPTDYLNCYIQNDNENYIILRDFMEETNIGLHLSVKLLNTGHPGNEGSTPELNEDFRNGRFVVKHLDKAKELFAYISLFKSFPYYTSRGFVIAIDRIIKAGMVDINDVVAAFNKRPEMLTEQANYKAYVNTLEQILNVNKQKRIVII